LLQLFQSIWLWAIAAIAVPVIIHLWNVKKGKTLKVGSIVLLSESASSRATSIKISEWLLLLLRCLMLIALALVLTKPFWQKQLNAASIKGWVMLDKAHIKDGYNAFQKEIDSLDKAGYAFHYFEEGFKEFNLRDEISIMDTSNSASKNYWSLIQTLNQQLPATIPVYLYTDNSLQHFQGARPAVDLTLKWKTFILKDSIAIWLQEAWLANNDSIEVIVGVSKVNGTTFIHHTIDKILGNNDIDIKIQEGKLWVSLKDQTAAPKKVLEVNEAALTIIIYAGKSKGDAIYLQAALDAIRDVGKRRLNTLVVADVSAIPPNYNWLFWLSEDTIPGDLKKGNLFKYEPGIVKKQFTPFIVTPGTALTVNQPIAQYQAIVNDEKRPQSIPVWKNGFGECILSKEGDESALFRFYSRFNPQWSDLVWSSEFPALIQGIVFPEKTGEQVNGPDKRVLDPQQIMPSFAKENTVKQPLLSTIDLTKQLWLLAFLLFAAERLLSHYSKKSLPA
jgi:hypothetical protein